MEITNCKQTADLFVLIFKHCDGLLGTENSSYFCGEEEQNERIKASFEKNTRTYSWSSYSGQASMTENINISAKYYITVVENTQKSLIEQSERSEHCETLQFLHGTLLVSKLYSFVFLRSFEVI